MIPISTKLETEWRSHTKSEDINLNIVVTLKNILEMPHLASLGADVFLLQTEHFTRNVTASFSVDEIVQLTQKSHEMGKKTYLLVNIMIHEDMLIDLDHFISEVQFANLDGIVCFDFTMFSLLKKYDMERLMIFQPGTFNTNCYDAWFAKKQGMKGLTVSKEVTLEEILEIADCTQDIEFSIVGHGYLEMFFSRRPLITNYGLFKGLNLKSVANSQHYFLQEEVRKDEFFPVIEDSFGTTIFRSKKLLSFQEVGVIAPFLSDFFIERIFVSDEEYYESIQAYFDYKLQESFLSKYQSAYDSGFYYRRIGRSKETE